MMLFFTFNVFYVTANCYNATPNFKRWANVNSISEILQAHCVSNKNLRCLTAKTCYKCYSMLKSKLIYVSIGSFANGPINLKLKKTTSYWKGAIKCDLNPCSRWL